MRVPPSLGAAVSLRREAVGDAARDTRRAAPRREEQAQLDGIMAMLTQYEGFGGTLDPASAPPELQVRAAVAPSVLHARREAEAAASGETGHAFPLTAAPPHPLSCRRRSNSWR